MSFRPKSIVGETQAARKTAARTAIEFRKLVRVGFWGWLRMTIRLVMVRASCIVEEQGLDWVMVRASCIVEE